MRKKKKNSIIKSGDPGMDFEEYIRNFLPWQLNVSDSKQVALDMCFSQFATFVRPLTIKAPEEFMMFFNEFKKRFDKIVKWRAPNGKAIVPTSFRVPEYFPNGRCRCCLSEKNKNQQQYQE